MEAMAYVFAFMVLAALLARFGPQLLPGRAGLGLQMLAAAVAAGLAIRAAGMAMDQVRDRPDLFLVLVAGMVMAAAVIFGIFARMPQRGGHDRSK